MYQQQQNLSTGHDDLEPSDFGQLEMIEVAILEHLAQSNPQVMPQTTP